MSVRKTMTTQVLNLSKKVKIDYNDANDSYSIVAKEDIDVGELILLEIVVWGTRKETIVASIIHDKDLCKELYPRTTDDPGEKMRMNMFQFGEDYVLGRVFSKFNHSCIPNCHMDAADFVNDTCVYGMWTHKKVKAGDELTIDYINRADVEYHDLMKSQHGFQCSCTAEFISTNDKRSGIHVKLGAKFRERDQKLITYLVDRFFTFGNGRHHLRHVAMAKKVEKRVRMV